MLNIFKPAIVTPAYTHEMNLEEENINTASKVVIAVKSLKFAKVVGCEEIRPTVNSEEIRPTISTMVGKLRLADMFCVAFLAE